MPFSLFLALKYLKPTRSFVSVVTFISVIGVLLGVAILVIVLSVMTGFDDMWREKILGFNAHLTVTPAVGLIDEPDELAARVRAIPGVSGVTAVVQTPVLMQHRGAVSTPVVVGVDPRSVRGVSEIPTNMVEGVFLIDDGHVVMGRELAYQNGIGVNDRPLIHSPQNVRSRDELHLPAQPSVSGIFELGMWEYDSRFIIASIDFARDLLGMRGGAHALRVMTRDPYRATAFAEQVVAAVGPHYDVKTWMQLNRTLFDALRVEKTMMFVLLVFITVVAVFCVTNTLIVITVRKTNEIGLFKALGFTSARIMAVFVWHGWMQCMAGIGLGILAGLWILRHMNDLLHWLSARLHFEIFPKSVYQLSEIPYHTTPSDIALVAAMVMGFCTLASVLPAWYAGRMIPAEALRHE